MSTAEEFPDVPSIDDIKQAVDGRNDMIHAIYQYQCRRCRSVELIGLGCGVEGPRTGATERACIPSPFGCNCLRCGGEAVHVSWKQDAHFALRDAPKRGRYFKVPKAGPDPKWYQSSVFAGEMGNPDAPLYLDQKP